MSIKIGDTTFDRVDYDAEADVLYLHVGDPSTAVDFDESAEGHALRFDSDGSLVGMTIVGVRRILDESDRFRVTIPHSVEINRADLDGVIAAA